MIPLAIHKIWILLALQLTIEGKYVNTGMIRSPVGRLRHISTLTLHADKTYVLTNISSPKYQIASVDTIKGEWYLKGDTLITTNHNVKWLAKRNSLIMLAVEKVRYSKKE